ncbi:acylphosphatase [Clostridium manihotivorum]|uniref:acylphosphatase n=1 Tax=Clostridium manihotivorum TaxID=2320868 RepID=A0A410DS21_9CLOT|nr:acylphosphatase [Clostridium manihotivorum]QAA31876.1 acylphosphatase [Clostridium manihotivorum]
MIRYHIIVQGRVQGVGFRYFVQYTASLLNITGTATNLDNGDVEIYAQGDNEHVTAFLARVKRGNGFSRVIGCEVQEIPTIEKEKSFKIV